MQYGKGCGGYASGWPGNFGGPEGRATNVQFRAAAA